MRSQCGDAEPDLVLSQPRGDRQTVIDKRGRRAAEQASAVEHAFL